MFAAWDRLVYRQRHSVVLVAIAIALVGGVFASSVRAAIPAGA